MNRLFHHENILILSNNEQAQARLPYELSQNDCEIRQAYNLSELEDIVEESPPLCLIIYLDKLDPTIYDLDIYKEFADQFFLIIIDALGVNCPIDDLCEIPFTEIISKDDETSLYDINVFLDNFYGNQDTAA